LNAQHLATLADLARIHGLETNGLSLSNPRARERVVAALSALGVPARNAREIRDSRIASARRQWRGLEPVTVCWLADQPRVRLAQPASAHSTRLSATVHLEDGGTLRFNLSSHRARIVERAVVDNASLVRREFVLPDLPPGYHTLDVDARTATFRTQLIVAPDRAYGSAPRAPEENTARRGRGPNDEFIREYGVFAPMYAIRSRASWGAGNFSDWERFCAWMASRGATIAGTLPLLAAFLDFPGCEPSPYSPASRLFWNEFYVDATRVPEFHACAAARRLFQSRNFQNRIRRIRRGRMVDYSEEWSLRREMLERLSDFFFQQPSPRREVFERFLREHPETMDYARFRAACDATRLPWQQWPARMRAGRLRATDCDPRAERFRLYVQWIAQEQVNHLLSRCRALGVKMYLDLPLGVNPAGYDVWRYRDCYALDASVGAPPDMFFSGGQDWGFAPLHPERIRELGYRHVLDFLRFQMRHTGLLRIDHVMQFHRLYWIPRGLSAREGIYVRYPADELYAILCIESHRHRTRLIGENLGTVPPIVNETMRRRGLRRMYVVQYAQQASARRPLKPVPKDCIAGLNTHDMPMFAAHWRALDIADHVQLGLLSRAEARKRRARRRSMNRLLVEFLKREKLLRGIADSRTVCQALLKWLADGPAEMVLVNIEDLLGELRPQNTPGTASERPNWRRRAKKTLERILRDPSVERTLREMIRRRRRTAGPPNRQPG